MVACFVETPKMGQGRRYRHLGLGGSRTQANNLVQGLRRGIELP